MVGKSDYFRFGMRDSLAIEASFLQREEELLSSWWREYAECSEGPRERQSSSTKSDTGSFLGRTEPSQLYEIEEERVGVPVEGGLYEVDLVSRHCFPVYWNGENRRVGHWFARKGGLDWLPLREDVAEQLEIAYRSQVPDRHFVFMVHGIGQRLEKSNLVDDVGNFRHITASLAEQRLTAHQRGTQRVLFIPCQFP
ncbi:phospholipase DDHD1 [Vigna unguiculata]|uniref:Phospholipase DDHD1 n=1 Tax=Vigna unguiculata TaxID=3917 RepID=A0A4D6LSN0_VIGUN|nr:phospholipase DDHD1 [Vigna unguiculata]